MSISATLKKFAKSREAAYLQYGRLTAARARAISKIIRVADFFSGKSEQAQLAAVNQVASEIREILPSEQSRYSKIRSKILEILSQSHVQHLASQTTHGRPPQTSAGSQGTQLSFI